MLTAGDAASRDALAVLLLLAVALVSRRGFHMRGVTYKPEVTPLWQESLGKALFYVGLLGTLDAALRRGGEVLSHLGLLPFRCSADASAIARLALLHAPFVVWAACGPLCPARGTRDDHGWWAAATHARLWKWLATRVYGPCRIVLSEEWRDLSAEERARWTDRHYVIGMHPHGLLPIGAILNGLTWAGGGLRGITASGAELPEPPDAGALLHQRWFRRMKLRAAVASGACGLFPGFYEMFRWLGGFECTKPFMSAMLREDKDVAIFAGGAQESSDARPGRYVCRIGNHKGFVRLALEERRDILPMWCFGDERLIPQSADPPAAVAKLQRWCKEALGLLVPPTWGGPPQFPPLTLVTGVPVSLEDLWPAAVGGEVRGAAVEEGHRRYAEAQRRLFDQNKGLVPGGHKGAVVEFL